MLEPFNVSLKRVDKCEAIVRLKPAGVDLWKPTSLDDNLWDETNKQFEKVLHPLLP